MSKRKKKAARGPVRYAVVGQGYIAQAAVLPAFAHARENSRLVALVSGDPIKLRRLAQRYDVELTYGYEQYDDCLASGEVDAVYIALPNDLHREYSERAARAGVHVLCEKPMALGVADCEAMRRAARRAGVKLMVAYRLHFERANLEAVELAQGGEIGEPRLFDSVFTMQVRDEENIRLKRERGGGPLWDIGIYCINAARYLFRAEPIEVFAAAVPGHEPRFRDVDESVAATLRFPGGRLASFVCSFGAADVSSYRLVGTRGDLQVEPAYELAEGLKYRLTVAGKSRERSFPKRDQFAPELVHFSRCILADEEPEPSGLEGQLDIAVIEGLNRSVALGAPVKLALPERRRRPDLDLEMRKPPVAKPKLVRAKPPSKR